MFDTSKKKNNIAKRIQKLAQGKVNVSDSVVEKLMEFNKLDGPPTVNMATSKVDMLGHENFN